MATELNLVASSNGAAGTNISIRKHILIGVSAGVLLLVVYAGIISLVQGWTHAVDQTTKLWYWVLLLATGFGVQAGLFSFIRHELRKRQRAATASVATSGGVSAGSMAACCAHHLGDVLPALGLSGLAAFLVSYQVPFIVLGVLSNAVGITVMLETIQRYSLCPWVAKWRWDLGRAKKWVLVSAGVVLLATFLGTFLTQGSYFS